VVLAAGSLNESPLKAYPPMGKWHTVYHCWRSSNLCCWHDMHMIVLSDDKH
jgi:hypothetical protein